MKGLSITFCMVLLMIPVLVYGADEIKIGYHTPLTVGGSRWPEFVAGGSTGGEVCKCGRGH